MSRRRSRWTVTAVVAICALTAAACGRSANSAGPSGSGNISPTKGLVAATPADVVYSLDRNTSPALGGFYGLVFNRVASIAATGSRQVTITLKQPDYWLPGELSSMAGVVIEKAFAVKEGKRYGTPSGSIMCTGAYELKSFVPGVGVT